MKEKSCAKLRKLARAVFQKYRRMQCANQDGFVECISCGAVKHYKECDGGHFIPAEVSLFLLFEPNNVWAQCRGCNKYKSGNHPDYRENLIKKIGQKNVDKLYRDRNKKIKELNTRELYEKIIEKYTPLVAKEEWRFK